MTDSRTKDIDEHFRFDRRKERTQRAKRKWKGFRLDASNTDEDVLPFLL